MPIASSTALLLIAVVIFLGFFGDLLFKRRAVPETVSLVFLGLLVKAVGLIPQGALNFLVPIFSQLTLAMILFDLGMHLDLKNLFGEGASAVARSALYMFLSILLIFILFHVVLGEGIYQSLILGSIIGGETTMTVVPYVTKRLSGTKEELVTNLTLESAFNSIVLIILFFVFLNNYLASIPLNTSGVSVMLITFFAQLSTGIVAGAIAGVAWIKFAKMMHLADYLYIATIGYVLAVYALVNEAGGSGILAVLVLGAVFLNFGKIVRGYVLPSGIGGYISTFQDEISFFLRTFFFVFLGLELSIASFLHMDTWLLAGTATLILVGARFLSTYLVNYNKDPYSKKIIFFMIAQGLTPAVLSTTLLTYDVSGSGQIVLIATLVIVLTNIITAVGSYTLAKSLPNASGNPRAT
ncbi:MAG: cation:proton antiporter [Nitrososphaerota archaeon]|nr:cation:proton antiporter [Nitrososphaerota archaeon]